MLYDAAGMQLQLQQQQQQQQRSRALCCEGSSSAQQQQDRLFPISRPQGTPLTSSRTAVDAATSVQPVHCISTLDECISKPSRIVFPCYLLQV
jgi:hypothetical protein